VGSKSSEGRRRYRKPTGGGVVNSRKGKSSGGIDLTNSPEGDFLGKRKVKWRENLEKGSRP
jgi:hypothetical protein